MITPQLVWKQAKLREITDLLSCFIYTRGLVEFYKNDALIFVLCHTSGIPRVSENILKIAHFDRGSFQSDIETLLSHSVSINKT